MSALDQEIHLEKSWFAPCRHLQANTFLVPNDWAQPICGIPELEILFRKNKVDTLTVSRIAVWNRGAATIDRNDIAVADPLRIGPTGTARLLDVKVVQVCGDSSRFEAMLNGDGTAAHLRFDFLDRDQGAVIQVIHTGASGDDVAVLGTVKGAGTPAKRKIRGAYLPLPTSLEFDRKIKPTTRRRITIACELSALAILVITLGMLFAPRLYPTQWAAVKSLWDLFAKRHSIIGEVLTFAAVGVVYASFFILSRGTLLRPMLPAGLMTIADDPLEL